MSGSKVSDKEENLVRQLIEVRASASENPIKKSHDLLSHRILIFLS
jgi:hypothetical protein